MSCCLYELQVHNLVIPPFSCALTTVHTVYLEQGPCACCRTTALLWLAGVVGLVVPQLEAQAD